LASLFVEATVVAVAGWTLLSRSEMAGDVEVSG
jgi:hypothetical protein